MFNQSRFYYVPVFCNFSVFDPEKVVESIMSITEMPFAEGQHKVTFAQYFLDSIVFHKDTLFCQSFQSSSQSRKLVGYLRVVLNVVVAVEVTCEFLHSTVYQNIFHEITH